MEYQKRLSELETQINFIESQKTNQEIVQKALVEDDLPYVIREIIKKARNLKNSLPQAIVNLPNQYKIMINKVLGDTKL